MDSEPQSVAAFVVDTHALFWYLTASPRLGANAKSIFEESERGEAMLFVPAIVVAELYFLNEKAGNPLDFSQEFENLRASGQFVFVPFAAEDVPDFEQDAKASEMHDRIILGVARRINIPCITTDTEMTKSGLVSTIW